jgi:hypothetical protein
MRHEPQITSLSWIPSEAVRGLVRAPFDAGITHYDAPPPDDLGVGTETIESLRDTDRFRFANVLRGWIEVSDGRISAAGYCDDSGRQMGSTTVRVPGLAHTFPAIGFPDIQHEPELLDGGTAVRFVQTCGGCPGLPSPRRVVRRPFVQWRGPCVWSTLALTMRADGTASFEVLGASRFPRHWIYGPDGKLAAKSGITQFRNWYRRSFGRYTPWGNEESTVLMTAVESALERVLSTRIMRGGARRPKVRAVKPDATLVSQDHHGDHLYLLLDGVVRVEKDGVTLAEYGPGALLGERASLEGGRRTASLVAVTPCRVAVASPRDFAASDLEHIAAGHRHESPAPV